MKFCYQSYLITLLLTFLASKAYSESLNITSTLVQKISPAKTISHKTLKIALPHLKSNTFIIKKSFTHENGDVSVQASSLDGNDFIDATFGNNSVFGKTHIDNKHYLLSTDKKGSWMFELPNKGLSYNDCGHKNHEVPAKVQMGLAKSPKSTTKASTVIDLLFVYNQALADRYPEELMQTRMNQYLNVTNQATTNSNLDLIFRQVGLEQLSYNQNNSNNDALDDLRRSMDGEFVFGMHLLKEQRETLGADIVIFIRPHDIEIRGSCGVAYYPFSSDGTNFDSSFGVHMISDGMDSWSICTDQVMVHELGHNLGAGHNNASVEQRFIPDAAGFSKVGQFSTVMGSYGTGRADRFLEIDTFSNPNIQCGGVECGTVNDFNNVHVIDLMKGVIANYQPSVSQAAIPTFNKNNPDSDNDGVVDWDDHFPFNKAESADRDLDGVGDNQDAFPNDPLESFDFDNDGVGDNQDNDDDNDGTNDINDVFNYDASETTDSDLDGVGDNADLFPNVLLENADFDADGLGDNLDLDDDDDSVNDFDDNAQDLLIINTGSNQIMRIDAQTGLSHGAEVLSTDGLLTFQSDLTYRKETQTLFYTSSSGVRKLDLMTRQQQGLFIPPYSNDGSVAIGTGFPTSLSSINGGENLAITRLNNSRILVTQGQKKASQAFNHNWNLIDGDNPIDIITLGSSSYMLGSLKLLYFSKSKVTVDVVNTTQGFFQNWMVDPYAIAVNDSNKLYITDQGLHAVGTVNIDDGVVDENFISLTDLGYSNPTGIALSSQNILLVAASDQNAILKFNAQTGEFLGELIKGKGLDKPHKMILVPKLNDRFHHDANKVIRPNAGLWYNPATNGRGFDIQVFNDRLSVIWYTYDEQGLPTWYFSAGKLDGFKYATDFKKGHMDADGTVTLQTIGAVEITFDNERNAQINWQIEDATGSESIEWLNWSFAEEENNYTGLWGRPDGPGWGVSVATIGKISVSIPYIYDDTGEPRWLISESTNTPSPLKFNMNAFFSDTLCPSCSGEPVTTKVDSGEMTLDLDNKTWHSQITYPSPLSGVWQLENTTLKLFSDSPERPR